MKKWILISLFSSGLLFGCEDSPSVSRGEDPSATDNGANDPPNTPTETPSNWTQIKMTLARSEGSHACGFQEFKIENSGNWKFTQCVHSDSGQLNSAESEMLDQRANAALASTKPNPCPEVLIFNQYYVHVQSREQNVTHTFDPQDACYEGGETEVDALRVYLEELQRAKVHE